MRTIPESRRLVFAAMKQAGLSDRADRITAAGAILGWPLQSFADLSAAEYDRLATAMTAWRTIHAARRATGAHTIFSLEHLLNLDLPPELRHELVEYVGDLGMMYRPNGRSGELQPKSKEGRHTMATKKTAKVAPSGASPFDQVRAALLADDNLAKNGSIEDDYDNIEVIPTGILGYDMASGVGGVPVGRVTEIYGQESCGKSTLVYHLLANAQRMSDEWVCVLIDTEGAIDWEMVRNIGVDPSRLLVYSPDTMESALDALRAAARASRDAGGRAIIVLDSVAATAPRAVMEVEGDQKFRANKAAEWSTQMPSVLATLRSSGATLILINQLRTNMGAYITTQDTPGGKAIRYAATHRVNMKRNIDKKADRDGGTQEQEVTFLFEKNKVAPPYREGSSNLPLGVHIDKTDDTLEWAIRVGIIKEDDQYVDGELIRKRGYFTLIPSEEVTEAIKQDLAKAEAGGFLDELPGTAAGPYLTADGPFSVYRRGTMRDVLTYAPRVVEAIRTEIYDVLAQERQHRREKAATTPYEQMLVRAQKTREQRREADAAEEAADAKAAESLDQRAVAIPATPPRTKPASADADDMAEFVKA